ncbi:MAG: hypothetical protein KDD50_02130, partial [Bdellovibrionales bacterium]|nr:hypothetical protein [Bdellovibrionales bacterium]
TYPQLKMISFKYEENRSHEQLMNIAYDRLEKGHFAVVANRGEEFIQYQDQVAYLVSKTAPEIKMVGKSNIADQIVNWMEVSLNSPQV